LNEKYSEKTFKIWTFLGYVAIVIVAYYSIMHWAPYIITLLLPFILAYFVAMLTSPIERFLEYKCHFPHKASAIIGWLVALLAFSAVLGLIIYKLIMLIYFFAIHVGDYTNQVTNTGRYWQDLFLTWRGNLPADVVNNLDTAIQNLTSNATNWIANFATNFLGQIGNWVAGLPTFLLTLIIFILASYFMCIDFSFIKRTIAIQFPINIRGKIVQIKEYSFSAVGKYLKGISILILIIFCIILLGLLILQVHNAFWIALVLAVTDALPLFGTGVVLTPWALYEIFITHNIFLGVGLLVILVVNSTVRQFAEPKVMSNALGLHPLLTLLAMFLGLKLFGFLGIILLPILVLIVVSLQRAGVFTIWKEE